MFPENDAFDLDSKFLGALPIVNHFLLRLQIPPLLDKRLPTPDLRKKGRKAGLIHFQMRYLLFQQYLRVVRRLSAGTQAAI